MASIRARIINQLLPLLGIKSFFAEPGKIDARLRKIRAKGPDLPSKAMHRRFDVHKDTARGYCVYTMNPKTGIRAGAPHLYYLHGGGYIMDISSVHWDFVMRMCETLGASATVPVYPLAPEHKAAEILSEMHALYRDISAAHGARNITIMGDSAGAGMALSLAQIVRDAGDALPTELVLLSPWLDANGDHPAQPDIEKRDRMLAIAGLVGAGKMYAGHLPVNDARVSPLFGSLNGLPPIQMFAGTSDILLPDAQRLRDLAKTAEGAPPIDYHEYEDMFHVWMLLPVPEAKTVVRQITGFIQG